MATLTFSYRSTRKQAPLEARLSFRISGQNLNPKTGKEMPYSYYTRSKIEVGKSFWKDFQKGVNFKDVDKINQKKDVSDEIHNLRKFVMDELEKIEDLSYIDKEWLKSVIKDYYNPKTEKLPTAPPEKLKDYIDYYVGLREGEKNYNLIKKRYNVLKSKLIRFNPNLAIKEINEDFKRAFNKWRIEEGYGQNTTQRDFVYIKTLVRHARLKGLEVNPEFEAIRADKEKTPKIYLSFKELISIREVKDLPPHLENARDWLVISCYSGQRISDFMRFNKSMIRIENNIPLLEFTQIKTGKETVVPVLPEVMEILDRRNGEFPKRISDQKYNDYIKLVCKKAKINNKIKGRIAKNISKDKKKSKIRNVEGNYEKYKLVTSHIGRRSFATNFYGKLPTMYLIGITNHSTERQFLEYIGKGKKDLVFDAYSHFMKLNNESSINIVR